jgi:hypothetical protein
MQHSLHDGVQLICMRLVYNDQLATYIQDSKSISFFRARGRRTKRGVLIHLLLHHILVIHLAEASSWAFWHAVYSYCVNDPWIALDR